MQIKAHSKTIGGEGMRVGIAVARFNKTTTDKLLAEALKYLATCGVDAGNITVIEVAGSVEIPYALLKMAETKKFNCLVALGCVIKGETPHFDYVCKMVQEGVLRVSLDNAIPIGFGVITALSLEQAQARVQMGAAAAEAALELATIRL